MGTEKYPSQNEYSDFLNKNSGMSNAETSNLTTNYYYSCSNESFRGALDRFAQFFIKPTFDGIFINLLTFFI